MQDELVELLEAAIFKEVAAEALYTAAQKQATDAGARALMRGLAEEERKHSSWLKDLQQNGVQNARWHRNGPVDLKSSDYIVKSEVLSGAGLQDTLIFAIKREQEAVEFYSKMMGMLRDRQAKSVCRKLAQEELRHKFKLEVLYDDTFAEEN
jgi:rubrerythrin